MGHSIGDILVYWNEQYTLWVIFPTVLLVGLYLTYRLRLAQVFKFREAFSFLIKTQQKGEGSISHYEAVSAVLAGNFGTGNISGIAVALTTGGPGALVWMWVMAFFGAIIQYASCVLGVRYRLINEKGQYIGGPMYYLAKGVHQPLLGACFAAFAIIAAFTVGNFAQVNSVTLPLRTLGIDPLFFSIALSICVGVVIVGGMQRFAKVSAALVPAMAILYLTTAMIILVYHFDQIIPSISYLFKAAFSPESILGGTLGFSVSQAISVGFSRGIFATDAGTGIAPMLQSSAKTTHPVIDGMVALIAPFLVMIVCTVTGLVLIVTGAWQQPGLESTNICTYAFEKGLGNKLGVYIVMISLLLFAYTTILAWASCGERALEYLCGKKGIKFFQYLYIFVIPVGAFLQVDIVWRIADIAISLMMSLNLIGVIYLSREIIQETRAYFSIAKA